MRKRREHKENQITSLKGRIQANTPLNAVSMMAQRRRRWAIIDTALSQRCGWKKREAIVCNLLGATATRRQ